MTNLKEQFEMTLKKTIKNNIKTDKAELNRKLIGKDLHAEIMDLVRKFNVIDKKYQLPSELNDLLLNHLTNVMGIITQHSVNSYEKKSGRPKNEIAREYFRGEVHTCQIRSKGTKLFPVEKVFFKKLDELNEELYKSGEKEISIDSKSFRNFKKEWKEGIF